VPEVSHRNTNLEGRQVLLYLLYRLEVFPVAVLRACTSVGLTQSARSRLPSATGVVMKPGTSHRASAILDPCGQVINSQLWTDHPQ
jgi:hypothetical protein